MDESDAPEIEWRVRLGRVIRELRDLRGVTQEELASYVGRTPAALSRWENGKATPTLWDARRMGEFLDAPAALFFEAPEVPKKVSPIAGLLDEAIEEGARTGRASFVRQPAKRRAG